MPKAIKSIILILLFTKLVSGQTGMNIQVVDNQTGEPLPFASFYVCRIDKQNTGWRGKEYGGITDSNGRARFEPMDTGLYFVKSIYISYLEDSASNIEVKSNMLSNVILKMQVRPGGGIIHDYFIINRNLKKDSASKKR